jgi:ubiquinone/menaquinone biosynthesis C-methylase UbiE
MELLVFSFLLSLTQAFHEGTFIPPYQEGEPLGVSVVSLDPPDFRGEEVYRINFDLLVESGEVELGMIHRSLADFQKFDDMIHAKWIFGDLSDVVLPESPDIDSLHEYLQAAASHKAIVRSTEYQDFLGINWSGSDLTFLSTLPEFMKIVIPQLYRAPDFAPEPPIIITEEDAITAPETPFEVYTYLMAFRAQGNLEEYLKFFNTFVNTYPSYAGLEDDSDVQPTGVSVSIPPHFNQTYVHFLPGGYLNGHTVRISYLGRSKFNFLHEDLLTEWLIKLHGDKKPKRILDIGTGPGFSAFVLAKIFPEAEVVAIDLAAPYIRMARKWQTLRNVSNIEFYHANAEDLSWLESESFDFINYAYVLHEMPAENALRIIDEMYRVTAPGGTMNGFEVPYPGNTAERLAYVEFNTWGHVWDAPGEKGPEPYMMEYEFGTVITQALDNVGYKDIEIVEYSYFESVFTATKN